MSIAGYLPKDLGLIDLDPSEMMFWMYLPISVPDDDHYHLPENLMVFSSLIDEAQKDAGALFRSSYVYLTAKTLWVQDGYIGNRPGWHIDGYGTDDLNYIWADRAPTEFLQVEPPVELSDDCDESLKQMEELAYFGELPSGASPIRNKDLEIWKKTYPDKHLLRLDNTNIHRSPEMFKSGMRTFVKISISPERYNLKGNAINHLLPETHWPLIDRRIARNHPTYKNSDFIK